MALSRTASVLGTTTNSLWAFLCATGQRLRSVVQTSRTKTRWALDGPVRRVITGPVRDGLLGRRVDVSFVVVLLAPVLALGTAWWVGSTVGYETLEEWVRGTWNGTRPTVAVFAATALLVALAAISAAVNSGLLPTTVLVAAPIFRAAVTRYGTEVAYSWGTTVVSLPEAVGVATAFALAFGFPLAVVGFLVGTAIRRVVAVVARGSGPSSSPERA